MTRNESAATITRNLRKMLVAAMEDEEQTDLASLGERIRQARRKAGLTQDELSDLVGVGMRQIQYYEAGESNPYRQLHKIAEATGASLSWLLHGDPVAELDAETVAQWLEKLEASQERVEEGLAGTREEIAETRSLLAELLRRVGGGPADQGAASP